MNVDRGVVGEEGVVGGLVSKQPQACGGTQLQIGKPIPRAHMSDYLELVNARVEQCMSPFGECTMPAISAHSIQRSRILNLLADSGHVTTIELSATAEHGLCAFQRRKP